MTTYTVRPGDTVSDIASRFNTTVDAIAAANHLINPSFIYIGQVLTIPGSPSGNGSGHDRAASSAFTVGSGITQAMTADGTQPASDEVYINGNSPQAEWSEAMGTNGTVYRWLRTTNTIYRYRPA
jgi:LysM repeat protein